MNGVSAGLAGIILVLASASLPGQQQASPIEQRLFEDGVSAQQRGDAAEALAKYRELLQIAPGATGIHVNLGGTLAHMGRFDEAIAEYQFALAKEPGNRPVSLNLAFAWKEKGDLPRAVNLLEPLHAGDPQDPQAALLLGDCYLRMERYRDAVSVLSPLAEAQPDDLNFDWLLGSALIHVGQTQEGVKRIERVAAKARSADAYLLAGQTRLTRDEYDLAKRDADAALLLNAKLAGGQTLKGMALQHAGDLDSAVTALQQAVQEDPNDVNAHVYLGAILYFRRDLKGARIHLERALALQPGASRARYELALVARSEGRMEAALPDMERVCRENPGWLEPHVELSALYYRLHRAEDGAREHLVVDRLMAVHQQQGSDSAR